ncbi:ECF-type sigma factor [Aporhodopirellula aestuarii]|uniref:ECF-type sigma factor n=1 Tax=Aporhodopirellula aestuarii TaxID=2950107 RepID=A0ABT0U4H2_9BACT|nr:ECF-type sigma factor [Aporhodopirellula aestuarii]MCM2371825.1 ECF-type sigma factor [Aporhodopirellula aestuarii]
MELDDELSTWIGNLKKGDSRTQQEIWNTYFSRLIAMTRSKLRGTRMREFDEEDIAISSFNSLFRAIKEDRVTQLDDPSDLWKLLVVITARKISAQYRRQIAAKRGSGRVRGESIFISSDDTTRPGLEQVLGQEPSPEMAMGAAETIQELMDRLPDPNLRRIAWLKFEGYSNKEISEMMNCVERTISRKIERIRCLWTYQETKSA